MEIQDVNFRELVDEAIFSIQDSLGDKPLRIEPQLRRAVPAHAHRPRQGQPDPVPAARQRREVHARGPRSRSAAACVEGRLTCAIRDTGIGICPDDQQFVFDEFFQVDEPSSQKYRGAGLGLTLVRDLIVLLEGEVSLPSDVGRGTTVTLRDPRPDRLGARLARTSGAALVG